MFKKRDIKRENIRKSGESSDDEEEFNRDMMNALKVERELKKARTGISMSNASISEILKSKEGSTSVPKNIESMMKSQYTVTTDDGMKSAVQHEKILEDYLKQRLGVPDANSM